MMNVRYSVMADLELLRKLAGFQTLETVTRELGIKRQSALNLLSKLKKEEYLTVMGGGPKKRLYRITLVKQRKRDLGMFDILNKYSPMKLAPWYDHQVHGKYTVEDALVDAVQTGSFRAILSSLRLFSHITDWPRLYKLAKKKNCWQKIGALHDVAKKLFRAKHLPTKYSGKPHDSMQYLVRNYRTKENWIKPIEQEWNVGIPFRNGDLRKGEV